MTPRAPEQLPAEYRQPRPQLERNASTYSKFSLPTSSQSNEADDEQSYSDGSYMESNATDPQYEGEDTRLTSNKELSGFYMYGWAAEVCSLFPSSTFTPSHGGRLDFMCLPRLWIHQHHHQLPS